MEIIEKFVQNFIDMFMHMSFYILLGLLFVGILHVYIKREKILKHLGKHNFSSVVKASVVGVPLPLCSCGVVPTAIELKKEGASNGAVISFLTSTPQTGVDSIFATYSLMGIVMAIFRPIAAFLSGIISGGIVNIFAKDSKVKDEGVEEVTTHCCCKNKEGKEIKQEKEIKVEEVKHCCQCKQKQTKEKKLVKVFKYAYGEFFNEIAIHFLIGILIATIITTFVPTDFFISMGLNEGIVAMISMVIIGLPMYICSASSIPIAMSLIGKGLSVGSGFVFLFAGPVTNIASLIVLNKALGKKVTSIYIACVIICSISFGMLLDVLVTNNIFNIDNMTSITSHGETNILSIVSGIIFFVLIIKCIYLKVSKSKI